MLLTTHSSTIRLWGRDVQNRGFLPKFRLRDLELFGSPSSRREAPGHFGFCPAAHAQGWGGQRGSTERIGPGCCQLISLPRLPRRCQILQDRPSTATCPSSSFSASWVSCCDSPGLAGMRATQHRGSEHFATADIPKAAAPGSASPKQGNLLGSQPRAGDNQRSTDHHRDCLQKCQKPSLVFFFSRSTQASFLGSPAARCAQDPRAAASPPRNTMGGHGNRFRASSPLCRRGDSAEEKNFVTAVEVTSSERSSRLCF